MQDEERYGDGLVLGDRYGEIDGQDVSDFPGDRSAEDDEDLDEYHQEELSEQRQFDLNRGRHGRVYSRYNAMDGVGLYVLPKAHYDELKGKVDISYCDQLSVYQDNESKLHYNPKAYRIFDGVIHEQVTQPLLPFLGDRRFNNALTNSRNEYYESYAPLAQNLAVLRNSLYTMYFGKEYDPNDASDRAKALKINKMAEKLGSELKWHDRWQALINTLTLNFSKKDMAVKRFGKYGDEHYGAQKMYEYLYRQQEKMSLNPFNWFRGQATRHDWGLPHPEDSPFCQRDMREAIDKENRYEEMGIEHCAPELSSIAIDIEGVAAKLKAGVDLNTVQRLSEPQRQESVALGHEILRRLKDITATRSDRAHEGLNHKTHDMERAHAIRGLAENYFQMYEDLAVRDPSVLQDSTFERARLAIGKLGHITMLNAMMNCGPETRNAIKATYDELPEEYKQVRGDTEVGLIRDVEAAMQEIANRMHIQPQQAPPEVRKHAQRQADNLHRTMSHAEIHQATPNARAGYVSMINEQRQQAAALEMAQASEQEVAPAGAGRY